MNDLEPWKIWAVTGILACAILSGTVARIRPQEPEETAARASVLTSDQRAVTSVSDQSQFSDQYEAYFSGYSHAALNAGGYSLPQTSEIIRVQDLMVGSAALSAEPDYNGNSPELDVTQQILGDNSSQSDQIAANNYQPSDYSGTSWSTGLDYPIQDDAETFADIRTGQLSTAFSPDGTRYTIILNVSSPDGNGTTSFNLSGTGDVRVTNMALVADQIKVAFSNANGNSIVPSNAAVFLDAAVTAAASQSQALDSEPQDGLVSGISPEDLDEVRAQAVEADVLARAEALAEVQSELQQRTAAISGRNYTSYFQFIGVKQE